MSNIVINGETYEGVESISASTPDGGTATFLSETVLNTKQNKIDENLNTESKEIVGAINELKESVDNIEVPEGGGGSGGTIVTVNGEAVETFDADTKLDKVTDVATYNQVYGKKANGTQALFDVSNTVLWNSIPYRSATDGTFGVSSPKKETDCANKKYVDEKTALYQHQVTFKFYNISEDRVIDTGTLIIPSKSATLIDTEELGVQGAVEELRKYVGRVVFADCTAGTGATRIEDFYNSGSLAVSFYSMEYGKMTAIIYNPSEEESTILTDIVTELQGA